jgi:SAM-dependent methyltransferase
VPRSTPDLTRQRDEWDDLARLDPLWAILTDPEHRHGRWELDSFFASGESEIADVLATAEMLGLTPSLGRALDFGCGVGRITRALSIRFERCDGIDISPEMIRLARTFNADRANCVFAENESPDLRALEPDAFDLVYSSLTLQHVPGRQLVREYLVGLVRVLGAHGLLVFQLPYKLSLRNSLQPKRRAYTLLRRAGLSERWLYSRVGLNPMRTLAVPAADVASWIGAAGAHVVHAERITDANPSYRYYVKKRP